MTGRPELAGLVQPDGSVTVPAAVAGDVLRRLARDIVTEAAADRSRPSPAARRLLDALYEAAERYRQESAGEVDNGDPVPAEAAVWTVREVADRMGCSPQYVRQLLAAGKLAGRKSGGTWIIYTGRSVADSQAPQGSA